MPTSTATVTMTSPDLQQQASTSEIKEGNRKKKGLLSIKSPFKFIGHHNSTGKTYCKACKKKCSGEVLRVSDVYFHTGCFKCKGCDMSLSQGGFFTKDKDYYCAKCYQTNYGTKCAGCGNYVEGEVVTALGKTYHQQCFTCDGCHRPFPTGERVTFTGKTCLCQRCVRNNSDNNKNHQNGKVTSNVKSTPVTSTPVTKPDDDICAGCEEELKDGQALMALDKQYHIWCFKCKACGVLLHGEYMGKDGHPYCEKDYQSQFGVKCTYCRRFISGKVLQAGDNNHFHPTCARCTKCGDPFGDGEEMFLQGAAIWHPRCGPGPDENGTGFVINGFDSSNNIEAGDGASVISGQPGYYGSRASSPGASLRRSGTPGGVYGESGRFSRSTTHVPGWYSHYNGGGLYSSSSTYSLRRPIEAGDRMGSVANINHFHLPPSRRASSSSRYAPMATPMTTPMATPMATPHTRMSTENMHHRPISCPPKPGYTHAARSGTPASAISPGPGMHFNDFRNDDAVSQTSFRTDYTDSAYLRGSNTFSHGLSNR